MAPQDEERINYERRMGDKWVDDLRAFKTSWEKPYLSLGACGRSTRGIIVGRGDEEEAGRGEEAGRNG